MTTVTVTGAPALPPSEPPAGGTTPFAAHAGGRSEAMIVTAVLAEHSGNQGGIRYLPAQAVLDMVERYLAQQTHEYVLDWRARVPVTEWGIRWDIAREVAKRLYPQLPGIVAVPDVYTAYDAPPSSRLPGS